MPSDYQRAIQRHRRNLRELEAVARVDLERAYFQAKQQLTADLRRTLALPGEVGPGRQFKIARLEALADQVDAELLQLQAISEQVITQGQRAAAQTAARGAVGMLSAAAPELSAGFQSLPVRALEELTGILGNGSPLRSVLDKNGAQAGQNARDLLSRALAVGKNPREVSRDLARILDRSLWRAELLARDAMLDAGRLASLRTYAENADVLDGWRWLAGLGPRCCLACVGLHGRRFPLRIEFFPKHSGCRCSPAPIVKNEYGPNQDIETGPEWFARQPDDVRRKLVPVRLWPDVDAGIIQITDFVQPTYSREFGPGYRQANSTEVRENAAKRGDRLTVLTPIPRNVQPIRRDDEELRRVAQ